MAVRPVHNLEERQVGAGVLLRGFAFRFGSKILTGGKLRFSEQVQVPKQGLFRSKPPRLVVAL